MKRIMAVLALVLAIATAIPNAEARQVLEITSPGGIRAWLVEDHSVALVAMRFAFEGGGVHDPAGKEGLAEFVSSTLDEGAGEFGPVEFKARLEKLAVRLSFSGSRDAIIGGMASLTKNFPKAAGLLRRAVSAPRFETQAVERVRSQLLTSLAFAANDPQSVAVRTWYRAAFKGHPYARPVQGTPESIRAITRDDLAAQHRRLFARDRLRVVIVGDIDEVAAKRMLDDVFGALPATAPLPHIAPATPKRGETLTLQKKNLPLATAIFGLRAPAIGEDGFFAAIVLNHILGSGDFDSRLTSEIRVKRGLTYSIVSSIVTSRFASLMLGGFATKKEVMGQTLALVRGELDRMARDGPTHAELDNAKRYLTGSYLLSFDTSGKIASRLLGIWRDGHKPGYMTARNEAIWRVSLEDVRRVGKDMLGSGELFVAIVGEPSL